MDGTSIDQNANILFRCFMGLVGIVASIVSVGAFVFSVYTYFAPHSSASDPATLGDVETVQSYKLEGDTLKVVAVLPDISDYREGQSLKAVGQYLQAHPDEDGADAAKTLEIDYAVNQKDRFGNDHLILRQMMSTAMDNVRRAKLDNMTGEEVVRLADRWGVFDKDGQVMSIDVCQTTGDPTFCQK